MYEHSDEEGRSEKVASQKATSLAVLYVILLVFFAVFMVQLKEQQYVELRNGVPAAVPLGTSSISAAPPTDSADLLEEGLVVP